MPLPCHRSIKLPPLWHKCHHRHHHTPPFKTTPSPSETEKEKGMATGSLSDSFEADFSASIPNPSTLRRANKAQKRVEEEVGAAMELEEAWKAAWPRRSRPGGGVMLEGYVEAAEGADRGPDGGAEGVGRTRSLTDDDLDELKGCLDLGFGFSYEEIPELCGTLPALELCYSMGRSMEPASERSAATEPCAQLPVANWKISSPGDHPEEVKARLKYWAQAVACTVRLCS
ncbi:hypothetical protein Cni_G11138 [Canna indica]|uniref:Uncharacterized protein n=1 Tax=Canna indica TaxID=4628 RepID=A0AAQ3K780_9LILI|nr:hypothetical protein Cni_G11138 [Canna indica]